MLVLIFLKDLLFLLERFIYREEERQRGRSPHGEPVKEEEEKEKEEKEKKEEPGHVELSMLHA